MWENRTYSLSVITSTVVFTLVVGASYAAMTPDVFRSEDYSIGQHNSFECFNDIESISNKDTVSMSTAVLSELQNNLKKLLYISTLQDNWNGNGASAFSQKLISTVQNVVVSLNRQPELFPTPANSIQLEYEGDNNSYLEIEILESEDAEVYRINRDGSEDSFTTSVDADTLNRLVATFYE